MNVYQKYLNKFFVSISLLQLYVCVRVRVRSVFVSSGAALWLPCCLSLLALLFVYRERFIVWMRLITHCTQPWTWLIGARSDFLS